MLHYPHQKKNETEDLNMTALQEPFRYDYVGSFLRPEKVKNVKALYEDGKIEKEELDETINGAIREVVAKQKDLGFHVITDGEFRRTYWHLDFMWGFEELRMN